MSLFRNPEPAYWAYIRDKQRAKLEPAPSLAEARVLAKTADLKTLAKFDLRPTDEILAEIGTGHPSAGITAEAVAALEAYVITEEAQAEDADQERGRLLLLRARSDRRKALAKAKRARVRAKAAAKEQAEVTRKTEARRRRWWAEYTRTGRIPMFLP